MKKQSSSTDQFPLLREFARGYLHEDLVPEHEHPGGAALAYLQDLNVSEKARLSEEAKRMRTALQHWTTKHLNEELAKMGSRWTFASADEFEQLLQTFEQRR